MTDTTFTYIFDQEALLQFVQQIDAADNPVIALDFEGESNMHRYGYHLCLVQIEFEGEMYVIDPVRIGDISPLYPMMANPNIEKVMYSCDFDVRLYRYITGQMLHGINDVQIAAKMLGLTDISLPSILDKFLGVTFVKNSKLQKNNWNKRPLNMDQLAYAARDVRYLKPLWTAMENALERKNLLAEFERLNITAEHKAFEKKDKPWLSIKGISRLSHKQKVYLKHFYEAREHIAQKLDIPAHWVIPNTAMVDVSLNPPETQAEWSAVQGMALKKVEPMLHHLLKAKRMAQQELERVKA
jgi:ribonuclease D